MSKKAKIIRKLSDGTVAKIGQIVVVIDGIAVGNPKGTITKITSFQNGSYDEKTPYSDLITCESINKFYNTSCNKIKTHSWFEFLSDLRKATPEERNQYYANKFSNQ